MKGRERAGTQGPVAVYLLCWDGAGTGIPNANNRLARESPYVRRGMQPLSNGFKLFLWISLTSAQKKSRIQMSKYSTTLLELHNGASAQAKTKQK